MRKWLRILAPPVLWTAYIVDFPFVYDQLGDSARVVGLVLVAASAWLWGIGGGVLNGVVGLLLSDGLVQLMRQGAFGVTIMPTGDAVFKVLAFAGTGVAFGYLRRLQEQVEHHRTASVQAQFDPLTGLLTRAAFEERLGAALEAAREEGVGLGMLFVDLDRFKFVNDTYGHETGDALLRQVGAILRDTVRQGDLVGRLGGDEFTVALLDVRDPQSASLVARTLVRVLNAPFEVDGKQLIISASVGVSLFPRDGDTVEALTRSADTAMYEVKEGGKNSYYFSSIEMRTRVSRRLELEQQLRRGLQEHEFELHYQPQVELATGAVVAFEALVRWHNGELGLVSPGEFIPVAEEAGLIGQLGHWLLREACFQLRAWQKERLQPVRMAINVSTLQFRQAGFLATLQGALADSGIAPELLEVEITESVLVKEYELAVDTITKLARLGVRTSLDDFGTGYSSLAYLQRLPIATLKIDQSFIASLNPYPGGAQVSAAPIVEAIVAMAHKLGKAVVAEGVETRAQLDYLRRLGVDYAQGFHFAKPLKPFRAERLLKYAAIGRDPTPPEPDATALLLVD